MLSLIKKMLGLQTVDLTAEQLQAGTIIDVRTAGEYAQGHAKNSINVPLSEIDTSLSTLQKMNAPIITCCKSGARSAMATRKLKSAGIEAFNAGTWQQVERLLT